MRLTLPESSLVLLVGASGAGKSTFAGRHFRPTEVISSDHCRGLVSDDDNDMDATADAFDLLHFLLDKRLSRGRLTVIDATNVRREDRQSLIRRARAHHRLTVAIVFNLPESVCRERNAARPDRQFGPHVIRGHRRQLRRSLRGLKKEGITRLLQMRTVEEVDAAVVERQPLWNDRRDETGPFDVIGDVHGCFSELVLLLRKLGWELAEEDGVPVNAQHPEGRKLILLGDLVDRGPASPQVLRLVMNMVAEGQALCVPGNHDVKLLKHLGGRKVKIAHGLDRTLEQLDGEDEAFHHRVRDFIDGLVSHYVLAGGRLVVAHAGLPEGMHGGASGAVRTFALYGETTGETDEFGLPIRWNWASEYKGSATVLYGHTPVLEPEWVHQTLCLDTGCVFGGKLSALRWPEREVVQVDAEAVYSEPVRPLEAPTASGDDLPQSSSDLLDLGDVLGKQIVTTRWVPRVTLRAEQTAAALEVMGRFAVDPRWLIYLPPTMAPPATCPEGEYLEHPDQALDEFAAQGIPRVICEEKHMGSRAVIVVARDEDAAGRRFGVTAESELGVVYTRTGRRFFSDPELERGLLDRLRAAVDATELWDRLETDWLCLDTELLPWSAKAQFLLEHQYAPIGAAARATLDRGSELLHLVAGRGVEGTVELADLNERRGQAVNGYLEAYAHYCWPVEGLAGLELAPFHLMASEGAVHVDKDHLWHLAEIDRLVEADPQLFRRTERRVVDLDDSSSRAEAVRWWLELTGGGGEGMVVKPLDFVARGRRGIAQPGIKCRGREYLRIIYGPEYTLEANLERLRQRGLGRKRSLARREFALGVEALERFVGQRSPSAVHQCVFGVLALESEPVDPRL